MAEILQPFVVTGAACPQLLVAAEAHFRHKVSAYGPRDLIRVINGFQATGHLGVRQVSHLWWFTKERLGVFNGIQLVEIAKVLSQFRRGLPSSELRQRFRSVAKKLTKVVQWGLEVSAW